MSKHVYCVLVTGHTDNEVLAYNVSSEAYESLEDAKAFIEGRSGDTISEDRDGWWAIKTIASNENGEPLLWFEYRIIDLDVLKAKEGK